MHSPTWFAPIQGALQGSKVASCRETAFSDRCRARVAHVAAAQDWFVWLDQGRVTDSGFSLQTGEHQFEFESTHLAVEPTGRERQSRVSGVAN